MMTTESILKTAQQRVLENWAARRGLEVKAIAPEMLMLVLEAVLMIIERCLGDHDPQAVAERIRDPGLLGELLLRQSVRTLLRETYGLFGYYRHGGAELVQALLESGRQASEEERRALVQHVRQRLSRA